MNISELWGNLTENVMNWIGENLGIIILAAFVLLVVLSFLWGPVSTVNNVINDRYFRGKPYNSARKGRRRRRM